MIEVVSRMELCSAEELIRSIKGVSNPCTDSRIELRVEYKYYNNEYGDIRSFIELKIGEKRDYNVKNMKAFLNSIEHKRSFEFGKCFSYNPLIHSFCERDTEILELLKEINSEEDKHIYSFSSYGGSSTLIAGRRIALPDKHFIRFLKLVKGKSLDVFVNGQEYTGVNVLEEEMPLRFKVCITEEDIKLSYEKVPIVLDNDFRAFWFNNSIYLPPREQLEKYKLIYFSINKENIGF